MGTTTLLALGGSHHGRRLPYDAAHGRSGDICRVPKKTAFAAAHRGNYAVSVVTSDLEEYELVTFHSRNDTYPVWVHREIGANNAMQYVLETLEKLLTANGKRLDVV